MSFAKQVLITFHEKAILRRRIRVLSRHIADAFPSDGSVLDVGCGDGRIAKAVMALRPDLDFCGLDVLLRPLVAIPACIYDGRTIPFEDESFDWVMIIDVLHHTDHPARILKECLRVSRKGVVVKDHLREGLLAGATLRIMDWVGNAGRGVQLPYNYLSKGEWETICNRLAVRQTGWRQQLHLYPPPLGSIFDRSLHFIATISSKGR